MNKFVPASRTQCAPVRGFTLIELMIVVAIVAILAGVALPAYFDYVRRGKLPEAHAALADFRVKMEQYYQDNRNYGGVNCADAGALSWSDASGGLRPPGKNFNYSCQLNGSGYVITATGSVSAPNDHVYTVNHAGDRRTTTFKGAAVAAGCWLTKASCDN
jgi:type IV pilus assembly protein PilE